MRPPWMIWQPPVFALTELFPKRTPYCIAVTVWNEGERLAAQLARMQPYAPLADIVIADWRSTDGSTDLEQLRRNGVRTLLTTDEGGLGTAVRMAVAYAIEQGYDGIITVDGNGKDGVDAIPRFLERLDAGFDFVQGSRYLAGGMHANTPRARHLAIRLLVSPLLSLASGRHITDPTNGFRAMSRAYLTNPALQPVRAVFVRFNLQLYLVRRAIPLKCRFVEIPVRRVYPDSGSTPTKIKHLSTKLLFFWELIRTVVGSYDPHPNDAQQSPPDRMLMPPQ